MGSQRLERHLESHKLKQDNGSFVFACTMCPGRFSKEVCLANHTRDFHREEHCLACGSCVRGARSMQIHVAENHPPEKMMKDVLIHGYDSPETFYQCSNCPRSFYEFFEAEHHFFTKHIVLGDCSKDLGERPVNTWWPWAQLYPELDVFADYRYFERELLSVRSSLRKKELELRRFDIPRVVCRKSAPDPILLDEDCIEAVLYQCEICDDLFKDNDLLEEHLGHAHMATCFDFPEMMKEEWRLVVPFKDRDLEKDDLKIMDETPTNVDEKEEGGKLSQDEEEMEISAVEDSPEKPKHCSEEKNLTIGQVQNDVENSKQVSEEVKKDTSNVETDKPKAETDSPKVPMDESNVEMDHPTVAMDNQKVKTDNSKVENESSIPNNVDLSSPEVVQEKSEEAEVSSIEFDGSAGKSKEEIDSSSSSKSEKLTEDSTIEFKLPIENFSNTESQKILSEHSNDATTETNLISNSVGSHCDVNHDVSSCDEKSHSRASNVNSNNVDKKSSSDVKTLFAEESKSKIDKSEVELPTTNGIAAEV